MNTEEKEIKKDEACSCNDECECKKDEKNEYHCQHEDHGSSN